MKLVNFTIPGGFPLTQDTLKFMQDGYLQILNVFYSHLFMTPALSYIITGGELVAGNIQNGWALVNGELLPIVGGTGSYLKINEDLGDVTFQDLTINGVYVTRYLSVTTDPADEPVADFLRVNGHGIANPSNCDYLADRSYKHKMKPLLSSLELDPTGNTSGGFILNHIEPFDGIPNGYELTVKMLPGSGLTFMTKNGVESNIRFNLGQYSSNSSNATTTQILRPMFGAGAFIGSTANFANPQMGIGYDKNVHVVLKWSSHDNVWKEIYRGSQAIQSNSI